MHFSPILFRSISAVTRYSPFAVFTMRANVLTIVFTWPGVNAGGRPSLRGRRPFFKRRVIVLLCLSSNLAISEGLFPSEACHRLA